MCLSVPVLFTNFGETSAKGNRKPGSNGCGGGKVAELADELGLASGGVRSLRPCQVTQTRTPVSARVQPPLADRQSQNTGPHGSQPLLGHVSSLHQRHVSCRSRLVKISWSRFVQLQTAVRSTSWCSQFPKTTPATAKGWGELPSERHHMATASQTIQRYPRSRLLVRLGV